MSTIYCVYCLLFTVYGVQYTVDTVDGPMELLDPRPEVSCDPRCVGPARRVEVEEGDVVLQGEGVGGAVVAEELGAGTEGVEQQHVVLEFPGVTEMYWFVPTVAQPAALRPSVYATDVTHLVLLQLM